MKKIALLVGLVIVASSLAVVTGSEPGKLIIWADDTRASILRDVGKAFTEEYGIPVVVDEIEFANIRNKLAVAGPSGEGPDIIIGPHDWIGELVSNGLIESIELTEDKRAQFTPVSLEAFTYGKNLYGVPYAVECIALIYNKDILPVPPETFEELIQTAKELTDDKKGEYGFLIQEPDPYHTFPLMSATGGYIFGKNPDGTENPNDIGLANEGSIRGVKLLDRLVKEGIEKKGMDYAIVTGLFYEGKLAMMLGGPWTLSDAKKAKINYGVAKIPTIDGQPPKPFVGVQGFMVSSFSENKMLANMFLEEFIATKETALSLYEVGDRPPAFLSALEEISDDLDIQAFSASGADGIPMPKIPEMASVWGAWEDALELIVSQKVEPETAMRDAVKVIKMLIEGP